MNPTEDVTEIPVAEQTNLEAIVVRKYRLHSKGDARLYNYTTITFNRSTMLVAAVQCQCEYSIVVTPHLTQQCISINN